MLKRASPWILLLLSLPASAAIFGKDDRQEVTSSPRALKLIRSTAVSFPLSYLQKRSTSQVDLLFQSESDSQDVCTNERFATQPSIDMGACTGFLVGPDLLATAGHCVIPVDSVSKAQCDSNPELPLCHQAQAFCDGFSWLFDFQVKADGSVDLNGISADRVYGCKRILDAANLSTYDSKTGHSTLLQDMALIQLDRKVEGRGLFTLSRTEVKKGQAMAMVGYPNGLPAKFTGGASVLSHEGTYFRTDLDAFGGNSGSPVLNDKDEVVGILVRGFPNNDFFMDPAAQCQREVHCDDVTGKGCQVDATYTAGSEVQRIQPLAELLP